MVSSEELTEDAQEPEEEIPDALGEGQTEETEATEAEEEETAEAEEEISLKLVSTLDGLEQVEEGTVIDMEAVLTGLDPTAVLGVTWMYSTDDGENFHIIEDATEMTYSYIVTTENVHYLWRVEIEI